MNKREKKRGIKKWVGVSLLIFSCLAVGCSKGNGSSTDVNTGGSSEFGSELHSGEMTSEDMTHTEEPTTAVSDYDAFSNEKYAWWFKRNTEHLPSGCQEDFEIAQYGAYYLGAENEKVIYLTFDCGYENGYTPDILNTLKEQGVKAAFFVTQTFIRDNVELTKQMKEEGHLVCNHTVTHPSMPELSVDKMKEEILTCADYMKEATGYDMDRFIRPPRGEYSQRSLQLSKDLGYTSVFWSMAYLDYDVNNQPGAGYVVEHFSKYHHPGAVVLMHNVSSANAAALSDVLDLLKSEGYCFGNLYDLTK